MQTGNSGSQVPDGKHCGTLHVHVVRATNLAADASTWVKLKLAGQAQRTPTQHKQGNPTWGNWYTFKVPLQPSSYGGFLPVDPLEVEVVTSGEDADKKGEEQIAAKLMVALTALVQGDKRDMLVPLTRGALHIELMAADFGNKPAGTNSTAAPTGSSNTSDSSNTSGSTTSGQPGPTQIYAPSAVTAAGRPRASTNSSVNSSVSSMSTPETSTTDRQQYSIMLDEAVVDGAGPTSTVNVQGPTAPMHGYYNPYQQNYAQQQGGQAPNSPQQQQQDGLFQPLPSLRGFDGGVPLSYAQQRRLQQKQQQEQAEQQQNGQHGPTSPTGAIDIRLNPITPFSMASHSNPRRNVTPVSQGVISPMAQHAAVDTSVGMQLQALGVPPPIRQPHQNTTSPPPTRPHVQVQTTRETVHIQHSRHSPPRNPALRQPQPMAPPQQNQPAQATPLQWDAGTPAGPPGAPPQTQTAPTPNPKPEFGAVTPLQPPAHTGARVGSASPPPTHPHGGPQPAPQPTQPYNGNATRLPPAPSSPSARQSATPTPIGSGMGPAGSGYHTVERIEGTVDDMGRRQPPPSPLLHGRAPSPSPFDEYHRSPSRASSPSRGQSPYLAMAARQAQQLRERAHAQAQAQGQAPPPMMPTSTEEGGLWERAAPRNGFNASEESNSTSGLWERAGGEMSSADSTDQQGVISDQRAQLAYERELLLHRNEEIEAQIRKIEELQRQTEEMHKEAARRHVPPQHNRNSGNTRTHHHHSSSRHSHSMQRHSQGTWQRAAELEDQWAKLQELQKQNETLERENAQLEASLARRTLHSLEREVADLEAALHASEQGLGRAPSRNSHQTTAELNSHRYSPSPPLPSAAGIGVHTRLSPTPMPGERYNAQNTHTTMDRRHRHSPVGELMGTQHRRHSLGAAGVGGRRSLSPSDLEGVIDDRYQSPGRNSPALHPNQRKESPYPTRRQSGYGSERQANYAPTFSDSTVYSGVGASSASVEPNPPPGRLSLHLEESEEEFRRFYRYTSAPDGV
eukprot:TRINITY_DN61548_c0_g4_i1.p1 TRINITY_DN61548_c0_g4~~TRINITY_DN61548_c0_g4_i1.p1  ORF type:complete len:1017 (+),score=124.10 TRINITY_DN61548_c0_g4_i1:49-3099(+)